MSIQVGIPQAAMNSLIDLVDNVAEVKPGMEVVIVAHKDGLYGGDNLVDEEVIRGTVAGRPLFHPLAGRSTGTASLALSPNLKRSC